MLPPKLQLSSHETSCNFIIILKLYCHEINIFLLIKLVVNCYWNFSYLLIIFAVIFFWRLHLLKKAEVSSLNLQLFPHATLFSGTLEHKRTSTKCLKKNFKNHFLVTMFAILFFNKMYNIFKFKCSKDLTSMNTGVSIQITVLIHVTRTKTIKSGLQQQSQMKQLFIIITLYQVSSRMPSH